MVRLVVFDLDGTLYDYNSSNAVAENKLICAVADDLSVSEATVKELLIEARREIKRQLGQVASSHNRLLYAQKICESCNVNPLRYAMRWYDIYWDAMLSQMRLYSYVLPLFQALLEKNIQIGILTDLTSHIQYRKLITLGVAQYIHFLTTSEEIGAEKPSARMFEGALLKAGCEPFETLMVGDDLYRDVEGARAAGLHALHFQTDEVDFAKQVLQFCHECRDSAR